MMLVHARHGYAGARRWVCQTFSRSLAAQAAEASHPIPQPRVTKLLIDGKFVDSVSGRRFATIDPRTEEVICEVAEASADDIDIAVKAARKAFEDGPWPRMSGRERGRILRKLADLLEQNADELAALETLDNGKPLWVSKGADVPLSIDHYRYFGGWADKLHGQTIPVDGSLFAYTLNEPIGVVGQIIPWNFPMLMQAWKLAPALAAGNCVVMKVAEQTPLTALRVGELCLEAGIPPGVVNILPGMGETAGAALASHMDVDKIAFTGSTEVGHKVMECAAKSNLKKVTLELGGKSPFIICEDADVDRAVVDAHHALFMNHGQCCVAGSRLFVHESIYDEFVEKSVAKASSKKVGDPFHPHTEQGPQVNKQQFDKIMGYIDVGKREGAQLLTGGSRHGDKGYYIKPTVFADVKDDHTIAREEIFGPVMSIIRWKSLEEVVMRANNTLYGLAAGIWTKNTDTAFYLSRKIKAGTVWMNCYNEFDAALPFGGYKRSGIGRDKGEYSTPQALCGEHVAEFAGEYAVRHYTEIKTVIHRIPKGTWL